MRDRLEETRLLVIGSPDKDSLATDSQVYVVNGVVFVEGSSFTSVYGKESRGTGVLFVEGQSEEGVYAEDLLILPVQLGVDEGWLIFWRDPDGADEKLWGRDWRGGREFTAWEDLVTMVYEL